MCCDVWKHFAWQVWGFVALKQKLVCWSLMASSPLSMGKVRKEHVRVHCEVWSVKCEVWSGECAVRSVQCGVWSVKWRAWRVKCGVWSVKCDFWSVTCEAWSVECEMWRVEWRVESVKCEVWSVKSGVWSVKCGVGWRVWSVKCGVWRVKCNVVLGSTGGHFVQALSYKVVLGSTLCKLRSTKWYWELPCASFVVQSTTRKCLVQAL